MAQTPNDELVSQGRLADLAHDEASIVFESFSRERAWRLGVHLHDAASRLALPVSVGIFVGQQRVFHSALPGASPDNDAWLERKKNVTLRFEKASLHVGEIFRSQGLAFDVDARIETTDFAAHGGAFPITVTGTGVVGAIGVSGLPEVEDHEFICNSVREFLRQSPQ